jgi:uncharacterized membrane protein
MVVAIPLGLFVVGVAVDIVAFGVPSGSLSIVAFWELVLAIAVGLLSGLAGLADILFVQKPPTQKNLDALAAVANGVLVAAFATSVVLRRAEPAFRATPVAVAIEVFALVFTTAVLVRGEALLAWLERVAPATGNVRGSSLLPSVQELPERPTLTPTPVSSLTPLSAGGG